MASVWGQASGKLSVIFKKGSLTPAAFPHGDVESHFQRACEEQQAAAGTGPPVPWEVWLNKKTKLCISQNGPFHLCNLFILTFAFFKFKGTTQEGRTVVDLLTFSNSLGLVQRWPNDAD